jgi:hypothetical protein
MSKPHPKGPRVFRYFFEADRHSIPSAVAIGLVSTESQDLLTVSLMSNVGISSLVEKSPFTVTESTAMPQIIQINQGARFSPSQGIDLTGFAGRVAAPAGVLGTGFDLPTSFFSRLNAAHPGQSPASHSVDLGSIPLPAMATKS